MFAAGMIALASAACLAAEVPANPPWRQVAAAHAGSGLAFDTSVPSALAACANDPGSLRAPLVAPGDARVADFTRLLHGTWVRRLTISGVPVETNSFWYFDMSDPETGRGQALMIDRVNQGWDKLASPSKRVAAGPPPRATETNLVGPVEQGSRRGAEPAATTGAFWSVAVRPAPADAGSRGHAGVTLVLAGEYHGTGSEYPPTGFRFTESGTFYRDGSAYATLHPWRAPPQAMGTSEAMSSANSAEPYSPVDAVVVRADDPVLAGTSTSGGETPSLNPPEAAATLTFIVCEGEIVDRYYKVDNETPKVAGRSLRAAWQSAIASGLFRTLKAIRDN
jgi:hypothetical protein